MYHKQMHIPQRKDKAQVASIEVIQEEPQVRALRDMVGRLGSLNKNIVETVSVSREIYSITLPVHKQVGN